MLLSALTIDASDLSSSAFNAAAKNNLAASGTTGVFSFAASEVSGTMTLDKVSVAVFTQALQNIATLRAENGGSVSRLQFSKESASAQRTNLEAANGRIMDVDIASESTSLAKYNILVQASASMLSQANATSNVALMLLN
jgi:flagellin